MEKAKKLECYRKEIRKSPLQFSDVFAGENNLVSLLAG